MKPQAFLAGSRQKDATRLIHQRYFTVDRYNLAAGSTRSVTSGDAPLTLIALTGDVTLHTPGNEPVLLGHCQAVVLPPQQAQIFANCAPGRTAATQLLYVRRLEQVRPPDLLN